jgi:membrane-associated phospholipid phosphatase
MIEYGEQFWGERWSGLYDVLGGNPLAAMPSLHFATTLMGAHLLSEVGPAAGAVGWTYTALLGLALVYLGEHYAVDLLAGAALAETVRVATRPAAPVVRRVLTGLGALEQLAVGAS